MFSDQIEVAESEYGVTFFRKCHPIDFRLMRIKALVNIKRICPCWLMLTSRYAVDDRCSCRLFRLWNQTGFGRKQGFLVELRCRGKRVALWCTGIWVYLGVLKARLSDAKPAAARGGHSSASAAERSEASRRERMSSCSSSISLEGSVSGRNGFQIRIPRHQIDQQICFPCKSQP